MARTKITDENICHEWNGNSGSYLIADREDCYRLKIFLAYLDSDRIDPKTQVDSKAYGDIELSIDSDVADDGADVFFVSSAFVGFLHPEIEFYKAFLNGITAEGKDHPEDIENVVSVIKKLLSRKRVPWAKSK